MLTEKICSASISLGELAHNRKSTRERSFEILLKLLLLFIVEEKSIPEGKSIWIGIDHIQFATSSNLLPPYCRCLGATVVDFFSLY